MTAWKHHRARRHGILINDEGRRGHTASWKSLRPDDGATRQTPSRSRSQQNSHRLSIGDLSARFQFRRRATADGMRDLHERIVRKTHDPRNIFRGYLKRFGAQHRRSLTQLLECDPVVQTAR